jgi:hypothetical protein
MILTPTLWSAAIAIVFTLIRGAWRLRKAEQADD